MRRNWSMSRLSSKCVPQGPAAEDQDIATLLPSGLRD
jgi:hypothetical protein